MTVDPADHHAPRVPTDDEWRSCNVDVIEELHAGKQSRVFDALIGGRRAAVKLTDARLADPAALTARLVAVDMVAAVHPDVVAPLPLGDSFVQPLGDWLLTATAFIDGERVDVSAPGDADLLGGTLAHLHRAFRTLPPLDIAPVAALASGGHVDGGEWQLLHGDFSSANVIVTPEAVRIFDFDDCGYGPVEFDIANSLYMALFDADVNGDPRSYERFRPAFLAGYGAASGGPVDDGAVDRLIGVRVGALARWLDDLASAPIGIRTSSPAWRATLAAFVSRHQEPSA